MLYLPILFESFCLGIVHSEMYLCPVDVGDQFMHSIKSP
jgi:hypothetical protein